ncbi:Uncharacterised protein [uncultured archaeon]|nr:Uncharacterised protein [uncultured archaeon]
MVLKILKNAESTWRETVRLATPLDSNKPVIIGTKPRQGDFEAYTDNKRIFINVDEKKFRKNFEDIIIPAYEDACHLLYSMPSVPTSEVFPNLVLDNFLFVHFHEQLHPWLCPNSKQDERKISKALYDGVKKKEPGLSKTDILLKVNNSKNLIWDVVLNISFLSKTAGYNNDDLEEKLGFVFAKNKRQIGKSPVTCYPKGILPIIYIISANNRTTDIPISLIGGMYSTLSYNNSDIREKALDFFLDDLKSKKISNSDSIDIIKEMYRGFISELDLKELQKKSIDKDDYKKRVAKIHDLTSPDYEINQKYFISTLTKIFDTYSMRYDSLKGFMKVLSPYMSLSGKQGSPDPNSMGSPGGSGSGEKGEGDSDPSGGGGSGDDSDDEKSQDELDGDSMANTLDDLLGELDPKEADDLLEEAANSGGGYGMGGAGKNLLKKIDTLAADEYYKRNADVLEVRNPSQENVSFSLGTTKRWKLVRTDTLTPADVSRLNHGPIVNFQRSTGLPVLIEAGGGFFKLNQYVLEETPQKSYNSQLTGIEIPDNWVFFQDSSGSMGSKSYVGTGCKFDILNRVKYGLQKGLYKVCKAMKKDLKFGVVDFSDSTHYSGLDSLIKVYESRSHPVKDVSLNPQCGNTYFNSGVFLKIKKDLAPGKSIYTFITDGQIDGDTSSLYRRIDEFSNEGNHSFVFIDVGSASTFGRSIESMGKSKQNVLYFHVSNIKSIKDKLGSILVRYK